MLRFYTINALFIVIFSLAVVYGFFGKIPLSLYLIFVAIWIGITALGAFQIRLNYFLTSRNQHHNTTENHIAITFDDGPNPQFTPQVLALLKKYRAQATFFLIGKNVEKHPEIAKQIVNEGHTIGNHTYSHSGKIGFFSTKKLVEEIEKTDQIFQKFIEKTPLLFRPPFGVTNPNINKALQKTGHTSIGWSKRSFDTTRISEERIFDRVTDKLQKGDVILLHDQSQKTVAVLERLLLFIQEKQLKSVSVDRLFEISPYE